MRCKDCKYCIQLGRSESQCGSYGRKRYYCDCFRGDNFIGFGDMTLESPLRLKTAKRFCPLTPSPKENE